MLLQIIGDDWSNYVETTFCLWIWNIYRGVFRTQSNICDGGFLQKYLTAFSRKLFSEKSTVSISHNVDKRNQLTWIFF